MASGFLNGRIPRSRRRRRIFHPSSLNVYPCSAFVLMEVLVSVAILAVGVTVLLESIISSLDANRMTQEYSRAIFLAESKMWEMEKNYAYKSGMETGESFGDYDPPFHAFSWKTRVEADERAVEYHIEVVILWTHRGKPVQYSLWTLVPMRRDKEDLKT